MDYKINKMKDQLINTLHLGDCFEILNDNSIEDGLVDLVIADLPFGVTQNKWDVPIPMDIFWATMWAVCKPNAPVILFGQGIFSAKLMLSCEKYFKYSLIWHKVNRPSGMLDANRKPLRIHEDALVFCRTDEG